MGATVSKVDFEPNLTVCLSVTTAAVLVYFLYSQLKGSDRWRQYGVKQVNMNKLALVDFRKAVSALITEHGDTVGLSRGVMMLITRDVELLKHVMSKDFNNFVDRMDVMTTTSAVETGVFFLRGQDWRRVRHVLSPSFSTGKLKHVCKNIEESAQKLANVLEEMARKEMLLPVKHTTGQYTSEIIARSAFGLRTDCLGKEDDDEFTHYAKTTVKSFSSFMEKVMLLMFRFKWLHIFLVKKLGISYLDQVDGDADRYFNSILKSVVEERMGYELQGKKNKPTDLLQSLVAAKVAGDRGEADATRKHADDKDYDDTSIVPNDQSWDKIPKTMSERELIGQSMLIIFAGFETTSTTLQLCLYLMAKHPDIQEKVYEEICSVVTSDSPTYEELGQLTYMEQVINETLRLFPPVPLLHRVAAETKTYGHVTIPKNAAVMIAVEDIMKDPKNYPDPEKFDPDRFSPENSKHRDPMTFLPFGYGPRLCIGMRLAYLELKIGLVHVLRKVKVELNEKTVPPIGGDVTTKFQFFIVVETPIQLEVKLRNKQK